MRVAADDRAGLERLCRYVARPAVCAERVALRADGAVTYRLNTPRRSGETHRVMRPEEFLARRVVLIPPSRSPRVRYHGVFAPNSPWRGAIVSGPRRVHHRDRGRGAEARPRAGSGLRRGCSGYGWAVRWLATTHSDRDGLTRALLGPDAQGHGGTGFYLRRALGL